ncbi:MAG: GTP-binding protein [Rhizobiales bacterium]|nr:GTP-binding protein [Hyphomicrobiales bacterium]
MATARENSDKRVPVTVVTGFLGAGKTTLLNRILRDGAAKNYAIIVNEFGDIGIDGELIENGPDELIELSSGCICCVVRGDLIRTIRQLLSDKPNLAGIIIETTGLANPSPVIQTMIVDQIISAQCRLDSVICLVDAVNIQSQLSTEVDVANQIAFSDHLVLNKISDASVPISEIETQLINLNPFALITKADRSDVPVKHLLNRHRFALGRIESQIVAMPDEAPHRHIDATGISSLSLSCEVPIDGELLEAWLQDLLSRHGTDILRIKGILALANQDKKFVLQAVNMMVEGDYTQAWDDDIRQSRLVFIGRNLSKLKLESGFESCAAKTL